jgi:hypothetical protein
MRAANAVGMKTKLESIDTATLSKTTGGYTAGWLEHHPVAAESYFSDHPYRAARFDADHPYAAARIARIAGGC